MQVTVKLYATLGRFLPPGSRNRSAEMEVGEGTTLLDLLDSLGIPPAERHLVVLNGRQIEGRDREALAETRLTPGATVAVFPPVAGGR